MVFVDDSFLVGFELRFKFQRYIALSISCVDEDEILRCLVYKDIN